MSHKGFSILELVMTMVIVAVAAMIVTPNIMGFLHAWDAENEAKKFATTLRELQQQTILENNYSYGVQIDTVNDCYMKGYIPSFLFVLLGDPPICTENNVDITTTTWTPSKEICFDLFGGTLVAPGAGIAVIFTGSDGKQLKVHVDGLTGKIYIQKL